MGKRKATDIRNFFEKTQTPLKEIQVCPQFSVEGSVKIEGKPGPTVLGYTQEAEVGEKI